MGNNLSLDSLTQVLLHVFDGTAKDWLLYNSIIFFVSLQAFSLKVTGKLVLTPSAWFKAPMAVKEMARDVPSTIHAATQAYYGAVLTLRMMDWDAKTQMRGELGPDVFWLGGFLVAYLAFDVLFSVLSLNAPIDMLIHHFLFLITSQICKKYHFLQFPFAWLLLGEWSTVPLNFRAFCLNLKHEGAFLKVSEILFALFFLVSRVILYGLGLLHMYQNRDVIFPLPHGSCQFVLGLLVGGYGLNLFWFSKILGKVLKGGSKLKQR